MSKYTYYTFVIISNQYVAAASFLYFHGYNIEYDEKQETVTNI